MNKLYYGDNLDVLRRYGISESVDLIYLDPPFNSNQEYSVLFKEKSGKKSASQIMAFEDTWTWNEESQRAYESLVAGGGSVADAMLAFHTLLRNTDMMAYLAMMAPRLVELRRVLKPTGSIYLHCDPTASHYLKLLMDSVFGPVNFMSEIIWRRTGSHNSAKRFGPIHDTLLFYAKERDNCRFRKVFRPYSIGHVEGYFKNHDSVGRYWTNALTGAGKRNGFSGKPWRGYDPDQHGRHWAVPSVLTEGLELPEKATSQQKLDALDAAGFVVFPADSEADSLPTYRQYLHQSPGIPLQDIWAYQPYTRGLLWESEEAIDEDVRWLVMQGDKERMHYPTQKPEGLLERVLEASSSEDDVVLDPFCGCGTTVQVAQKLKRRWIGIDITHLAIGLIKNRLATKFGEDVKAGYEVIGEPTDLESAKALALENRFQFQAWALGLVGARTENTARRGADHGIDGKLVFREGKDSLRQIILSVKSGNVQVKDVRDLIGTVQQERAAMGVLITLQEPSSPMETIAIAEGFYESPHFQKNKARKIQILTIEGLLNGAQVQFPRLQEETLKAALRERGKQARELKLPLFVTEE